jgi:hypothetical protein
LINTLPAGCTESTLYDILRPYGPIYSLKIDAIVGGLVQFWDEVHAQDAEMHLAAEQAEANMILNSYDPCSLFCSVRIQITPETSKILSLVQNLSLTTDAFALRTYFAKVSRPFLFGFHDGVADIFRAVQDHRAVGSPTLCCLPC